MAEGKRCTGTVKWFSGQKGFGFITPDDGGDDLFVHQTEILSDGFRTLREGQRVEFVVDSGEDGRTKAIEVAGVAGYRGADGGRGGATTRGGGSDGRRGYDWRGRGSGGFGRYDGDYGRGGQRGGRTGGSFGGSGGAECYNCGRMGHLARDCYQRTGGRDRGYGGGGGGGRGRGRWNRGYGGGDGVCYNCGEEGHFARDCPNDQK